MNIKKSTVSVAILAVITATPVQSAVLNFDWSGNFTMLSPEHMSGGKFIYNADADAAEIAAYYAGEPYNYYAGTRTPVSGTMTFDTVIGSGSATILPFDFFEGGPVVTHDITLQSIGDGFGSHGSLILTSMLANWNNTDIDVQLVWDTAGLFAAFPGMQQGDTIDQLSCENAGSGCVVAGSEDAYLGISKNPQYFPMGAIPVATTTYNVNNAGTDIGGGVFTTNGGSGPIEIAYANNDDIAGSPMNNGPFPGYNASFDMTSVTLASITVSEVPIPAAIWLFGSGLITLFGFSYRSENKKIKTA